MAIILMVMLLKVSIGKKTTDVGSFVANSFGLYDMHGNVWEWCLDTWHENYQGAPGNCQPWCSGNDNDAHLLRGGSWNLGAHNCRSAIRSHGAPDYRDHYIGFRVALSAQ
jgi:formylglycine-generating enzyme required for sulfatase activity